MFRVASPVGNNTAILTNGFWEPGNNEVTMKLCTICAFDLSPALYLKGACRSALINWVFYPVNNGSEIIYEGYRRLLLKFNNESKEWNLHDRAKIRTFTNRTKHVYKDEDLHYPAGRNIWYVGETSRCNGRKETMSITLSSCQATEEFTCSSGQCISLFKRCDKIYDCYDKSDEKSCQTFTLVSEYDKEVPPAVAQITKVNVSLSILTVNRVDTMMRKIELTYTLQLSWVEERMTFNNIVDKKNDSSSVKTLSRNRSDIWDPFTKMIHINSIIGSVDYEEDSKEMRVNVTNKPISINPEMSLEEIEYPGEKAVLFETMRLKAIYDCYFDLFRFPFDKQVCKIKLKIKDFSNRKMELISNADSVEFVGPTLLQDFRVVNWSSISVENRNGKEFWLVLTFQRLYQQQLTAIYLQFLLLWTVSYFTLFIDVYDFSNRFMGAVTALLVLCALMDAINQRLPISADLKLVDIWIIWFVFQIIIITFLHIMINGLLNKSIEFSSTRNFQPQSLNKLSKILLLILNLVFIIAYTVGNIFYTEEHPI